MANDLLKKIQKNQNAILTAKAAYNVAAKKKDKAAMDKAHKDADKARGYTTNTVKTGNGYVQSATKLTENKKQTPTLPVRTTGNPKLATPKPKEVKANQERNTQVLLKELNGKNGKTAAFIKGAALASVDPLGLHKLSKGEDPRVTKALERKTNTVKSAPNASFAARGFAVPKARTDKVKVETLGEIAGSLAAVDVVGNAAIKGATKLGGKIINKLANKAATETIPVVKNGVVKFEKVLKPTSEVTNDLKNVKLKASIKGALPTKVKESPLPQPPIKATQPQNTIQGTKLPQAQKVAENAPNLPRFKDLGADVNRALPKSKISKFRENTIENGEMFQGTKEGLDPTDYAYNVVPEKESLAEAKQRLSADFNGEVEDLASKSNFDGVDMDTAMGIAKEYTREAQNTGDYTRLREWTKRIRERGTEGGQLIQAFAKYSRSPEGAIVEGQRVVDSVEKGIKKTNPNLIDKVNSETKAAKDVIKKNQDDTIKSLGGVLEKELDRIKGKGTAKIPTPADKLAGKISATTKMRSPREPDAINDMVNELFRGAKESPLPEAVAKAKRNPIQYLAEAIQNKAVYTETWNEAKNLIKAKYEGDNEVLSMLDDYFEKGIVPTYSNSTLNSSVRRSAKDLSIDLGKIIKQAKGDKETALRDITSYLVRETGSTGEDAVRLSNDVMAQYDAILKEKTESTLKQMFKEVPKKGQKSTYEKVMELVNMGAYEDDMLRDIIKAKNKLPVLDNNDVKNILENMKKAEELPEGSYMQRMHQAKAEQIIADKVPADRTQKFAAFQRLNMIGNTKTLITRNPLGNALLAPIEMAKDVPATAVDLVTTKLRNAYRETKGLDKVRRTTTMNPYLKDQFKGVKQGVSEWRKDIKYGVDTSPSRGQAELPNGRTFNNGTLHKLDTVVSRALQLGDRPAYQAAYNARTAELKKLGYPLEDIDEMSRAYALDKVFQNDSNLAKATTEIRRTVDKYTGGIVGHVIMPFAQTPANLLDKLIDYSPAGYARGLMELGKTSKGTFNQKVFADKIGRALTGSGISLLGFAMAANGMLTGDTYDPANKDKNAANAKAGVQPYSVKLNGKYYSYEWIPVIGPLLAASTDAFNAGRSGKDFVASLGIGTKSAINTTINQSMLQGVYKLFSGYDAASGMADTLLGSTTQFTQSMLANAAKTIDPYVRETYDPNPLKQQGNKLLTRIPLASKTLPKRLDITGQPIMQSQGRGTGARALENFLLPQKTSEVKKNTVNDEVLRLQNKTGDNGVLLNQAQKSIAKNGTSYTLSTEEYQKFQKDMAKEAVTNIERLITTPKYKNMNTDEKAKALSDINKDAKHNAQNSILRARGVIDELSDMSDNQVEKYNAYAKPLKISKAVFAETVSGANKLESDKDKNGESLKNVSEKKKAYIDKYNPNATPEQLDLLYEAAGVSQTIGHYMKKFD